MVLVQSTIPPPREAVLVGAVDALCAAVCHKDVTGCRMSCRTRSIASSSLLFNVAVGFGLMPPPCLEPLCEYASSTSVAFVSGPPARSLFASMWSSMFLSAPPTRRAVCTVDPPSFTSWKIVARGFQDFGNSPKTLFRGLVSVFDGEGLQR